MDTFTWSEIAVRLLFAFILGSGMAIEAKWYKTKRMLQSNAQIAIGAAMFAILIHLTTDTIVASQLILGVSIICAGILLQQQINPQSINTVIKLWCAGAAGSLVGYGLFVPAYLGTLVIILASWIFKIEDSEFTPKISADLENSPNFDLSASFETENETENIDDVGDVDDEEEPAPIIPKEMHYQCQVICPVAEEIKVLALLVQLGKEQQLIPSSISSHNIVDRNGLSEVQIEIDFVAQEHHRSSPLQLQQILSDLKLAVEVSAANWVCLSSETTGIIDKTRTKSRSEIIDSTYRNYRQFVIKN